ncbi:ferredoxin [Streptomyces sp. NPDC001508]|uniref:ferredoxin n=1 Tax=Streptomyces sp. NPDC001508 TaxID=3154656 RepID=UPI003318363E
MTVSPDPGPPCHASGACADRVPPVVACQDGYGLVRSAREHSGGDALVQETAERCASQSMTVIA